MEQNRPVTSDDVRAGIRALGLSGIPLCIHSSLRSFGWVDGGAATIVDGVLLEGCTMMVPAFTGAFQIAPPDDPAMRPRQNAYDYLRRPTTRGANLRYAPTSNEIDRSEVGVIPAEVVGRTVRARGNNPIDSFAAVGPLATQLVQDQAPRDVYAPFRALAALGGWIVLMAVGLDRMTLLHHAETLAGRRPFLRWANGPDGQPIGVDSGGCSDGFPRLEPFIGLLARETMVGTSRWRAFPAEATAQAAAAAMRRDPEITHCADPACLRCADAIAGGPIFDL